MGSDTTGTIRFNSAFVESFAADESDHYGFVVDYRGAQPIVHVIVRANETPSSIVDRVHYSATLETTEPIFLLAGGGRRSLDVQQRILVGNDLTRSPFRYDAAGLLAAASIDGTGLVLGWAKSHATGQRSASPRGHAGIDDDSFRHSRGAFGDRVRRARRRPERGGVLGRSHRSCR